MVRRLFLSLLCITVLAFSQWGCGRLYLNMGLGSSSSVSASGTPDVPTMVQAEPGGGSMATNNFPLAFPSANTAGNLIVVVCTTNNTGATLSVSDTRSNVYTLVTTATRPGYGRTTMFYSAGIAAGANTVTCNSTVGGTFVNTHIAEYRGVDSISPLDASATGNANSTNPSLSLTTTRDYSLVVHYIDFSSNPVVSDTSSLLRYQNWTALSTFNTWQDRVVGASGLHTSSATITSQNWMSVAGAFKWSGASSNTPAMYLPGGSDAAPIYYSSVMKSFDGINWTNIGNMPGAHDTYCSLVYNNAMWVFGGWNGTVASSAVYKSVDGGLTWSTVGNMPATRSGHACMVNNGLMWVLGGSSTIADAASTNTVWSSADGVSWNVVGNLPAARNNLMGLAYNNKLWAFQGYTTAGAQATTMWSSATGGTGTWNVISTLPGAVARTGAVVLNFAGLMTIIGGDVTGTAQNSIYTCSDPCGAWTLASSTAATITLSPGTVYNNKIFLYGNALTDTQVRSSPDAAVWTNLGAAPYRRNVSQILVFPQ